MKPGWNTRIGLVFFFQAEDGIRDGRVTGVQTCPLPISLRLRRRPLITVAGTMDALLPIDHHARAYARKVAAAAKPQRNNDRGEDDARTAYRLYEIQNGNHLETNQLLFSQLELIQPHAQKSFDLLVEQVENGRKLPPSQCVPRGGAIAEAPAQPGHCASLFVP